MSKIQAVNYQNQPKSAQKHGNYSYAQNFGLGLSELPKGARDILVKETGAKLRAKTGKIGKAFTWLSDTQGELQAQIINNFFTGTLAYVMIAHNPFSKNDDENKKKYSAWRQPISAVIAMTVGFGMTLGINRFMDNLYHKGHIETIDLRLEPGKEYLKRAFKKHCKKTGTERTKENLNNFKEKIKEERMKFFTQLAVENPDNIEFDKATKAIKINGKDIQEGQTIKVPGFETKEALDKYLKEHNLHNLKFKDFLSERFGFEFYPENGDFKPQITKAKLDGIKTQHFLKEMGLIEEVNLANEEEVIRILSSLQQARQSGSFGESARICKTSAAGALEIVGKTSTRIGQMMQRGDKREVATTNLEQFFHQAADYLTNDKTSMETLVKLKDETMAEVLIRFKNLFVSNLLKGFKKDADLTSFAKNILKNSANRMAEHSKNYQKYTGIVFNLITTAISCTILNWAHPRVMESFFPELIQTAKKPKTEKGGNK